MNNARPSSWRLPELVNLFFRQNPMDFQNREGCCLGASGARSGTPGPNEPANSTGLAGLVATLGAVTGACWGGEATLTIPMSASTFKDQVSASGILNESNC